MTDSLSIAWLRREMRLHDNAVLAKADQLSSSTQPIFIFDSDILERFTHKHDRRITFIASTLITMHLKLQQKGSGVLVFYGKSADLIPRITKALNANHLVCAEDFEPACIKRDAHVKKATHAEFHHVLDHVIIHPSVVLTGDGGPYRVYSPFAKQWYAKVEEEHIVEYDCTHIAYADYASCIEKIDAAGLELLPLNNTTAALVESIGYKEAGLAGWETGEGQKRLEVFSQEKINNYKDNRDIMCGEHTSQISPYLRFGHISVREAFRAGWGNKDARKWLNELVWREFYHAIMHHFPEVVTEDFQEKYRGKLAWDKDEKKFNAWKEGKTGFPIVDAAMRQLLSIGWMHNRARMIVASFLTKDLHIDWRKGEEHFAQHLMDYELSSNNGGWQWSASTGADGQPYFRVFNPLLQSKRFDPEGDYIRTYVEELRDMSKNDIHDPSNTLFKPTDYPAPIVEHHAEKERAIAMFKAVG